MSCSAILAGPAPARLGGVAFAAMLTIAMLPNMAPAAACGDDIDGKRVPCACGDEVVSSVVLRESDPVVQGACPGDGLLLVLPSESDGVTVNLGGLRLSGTGNGVGIRVVRGGNLGSSIVGGSDGARAEITGFRTGISAHGSAVLREVRGLDVRNNRSDGLRMRTSGVRIEDVVSDSNGRDGIAVTGRGVDVKNVTAVDNVKDGVRVRGKGASVSAETSGNLRNGTVVSGRESRADNVNSTSNGGIGLKAKGSKSQVADVQSADNARKDLVVPAGAAK